MPDLQDDLIGTSLNGTYRVTRILGEGGMGRVYEAQHARIAQKRVAVKVLHSEFARNAEVLARFQREAEAAASVSHPNVVHVYDVDRTPQGMPYLVCEYLEGIEFAAHLEQVGKVSPLTAVHIAYQIAKGLEAAHARGVIHRDLKPQNVFLIGDFSAGVPPRPSVKVLDFGLSRFLDASDSQLTKTGVIMGTPAFMSPEQAGGLRCDHRVDIYGLGAILYNSVTGRAPFDEDTPQATVIAVMGRDPPRPRSLVPEIPEYLEHVIQRAMAKDPGERYSDMSALRLALEPLSAETDTSPPPPVKRAGSTVISRPGSRATLDAEAEEVRLARPHLVFFLLLSALVLSASAAIAITGVERAAGFSLSRVELGLLLFAVLTGSLTPALLTLRRIRREIWDNSARVLVLLRNLRTAVLTGIVTYGLCVLLLLMTDHVLLRFLGQPIAPFDLGWPGWNLLLPLIGMIAAGAAFARRRIQGNLPRSFRRSALLWGLLLGAFSLSALALGIGRGWQDRSGPRDSSALTAPPNPESPADADPTRAHDERAPAITEEPATPPSPPATDDELAAAVAQGVDGLLPLAEKHPTDPAVLRALALAFASRATGHADAVTVVKRLLQVAPTEMRARELQLLIAKTAETPGEASKLSFELLTEHMGSAGPDILYDLSIGKSKAAEQAGKLLESTALRARFTPALAVALDLRRAPTCEARVPLLARAAELGDQRSIGILSALSTGSSKGCGKWKRSPCNPQCAKEAKAFREAIEKIASRIASQR